MNVNIGQFLKSLLSEEQATTAVEYAVLLALILVFCIAAILSAGDVQKALWFDTASDIQIIVPN
jgi:Flp pilus assembly pilin Flp